jgi:branched-chain amino acid transport system permease protein
MSEADAETGGRTATALVEGLDRYRVPLGLVVLVVALRPALAHPWLLDYGGVATTVLIWMLFVAAFNLLFGFTGLLSFGHAMFLGFGMYGAAIAVSMFALPYLLGAAAGVAFAAAVGYFLGRLIVHKGEIYFAMLTLATAEAIYFVVNRNPFGLTGGSNGISQNTLPPWIETYRGQKNLVAFGASLDWYWVVAAVFLVAMIVLWQVIRSPFGRSLVAVRENENLARAMGVDTDRYKVVSFTVSGVFAAVAGALLEITDQGAAIETFAALTSGNAVLMAVLGGVNHFFGPIAGVFVWRFAEEYLTNFETLVLPLSEVPLVTVELAGVLSYWRFFLGALFVVVVVVSPKEGVWGAVLSAVGRVRERLTEVRR